jgi:hypothetical protein
MPAGEGSSSQNPVVITVNGLVSPAGFIGYTGPTLTSSSPPFGPTLGGQTLRVDGSNFGTNPSITVNNLPCARLPGFTDVRAFCLTPAGTGAFKLVKVFADDQQSGSTLYSYERP